MSVNVKDKVLDQLISGSKKLDCYPDEERALSQSLQNLASDKKSGSILVLGPRGAGKTTLVNSCLQEYERRVGRIDLNGMLQPTDSMAIRTLASSFGKSVNLDDEDEASAAATSVVRDLLKSVRKPLVIVVEEFDRYALGRSTLKQCLLYSLLDATYNSSSPLLVIGLSSNLDLMSLLEKRVRSRMSQKPLQLGSERPFDTYLDHARALLKLDSQKKRADEINIWNASVDDALKDRSVVKQLRRRHSANCSIQNLQQYLTGVVALSNQDCLSPELFQKVDSDLLSIDSHEIRIQDLSLLEMILVASSMHCLDLYGDVDDLNFELIYKHYLQAARTHQKEVDKAPMYAKPVMQQAFYNLCELGIFAFTKTATRLNTLQQFKPVKLQICKDTIKSHIQKNLYPIYFNEWISK